MPRPRRPSSRGLRLLAACAVLLPPGCASFRDTVARQDVESLQGNVLRMEDSIHARQSGLNEQLRELREELARLEGQIEEGRRGVKSVGQRVDLLREKTQEDLDKREQLLRESLQLLEGNVSRLGERTEAAHRGLQAANEGLAAITAYEKKQEERIGKLQEQLQGQLRAIVQEVGQENQAITRSITALRADLAAVQQDLGGYQKSLQQVADQLAATQGQVQDLARKQEAARRAAARPDQHVVRSGETLTAIAARYGVSVQELMEANRISDPNLVQEGQRLTIPGR